MVPGWVGTSLVRTFRVDSSGQSMLTRQVPGETDVLVWRRMVDYAARCGAGSWPQTAFWAITPVTSRLRQRAVRMPLVGVAAEKAPPFNVGVPNAKAPYPGAPFATGYSVGPGEDGPHRPLGSDDRRWPRSGPARFGAE
jgi:hypothetical protein